MESAPQYRAFKHHYGELKIGLDPASVSPHLFSRDLLTREENTKATHMMYTSDDKMTVILEAVEKKILVDPEESFDKFMEVLEQELAFKSLLEKLKGTYTRFKQEGGADQTDYGNGATPQRSSKGYQEPKQKDLIKHVRITEVTLLGLELGIDQRDMDSIEKSNPVNDDARKEVFKKWLKICKKPTWWAMVDAVEETGDSKLAGELEEKFCK